MSCSSPRLRAASRTARCAAWQRRPEAAARDFALWSLRAVGRHEDAYGLAQKSPVFPGIRYLELQQAAEVAGAQEHRQEQVRCLNRVAHLQRACRVRKAQVCRQLAVQALRAVLVERTT